MSAHIIGRPNDDIIDILLGHGADPESWSQHPNYPNGLAGPPAA